MAFERHVAEADPRQEPHAASETPVKAAEQRPQKLVAIQFFVLVPPLGFQAVQALVHAERPDTSWLGIGLSASTLVVMPYLDITKQHLADQLGSAAIKGEGRQNMLCAYLAGSLPVGVLGNTLLGAWWLDPAAGLLTQRSPSERA